MTLELAGRYLSVSPWIIEQWINSGALPLVKATRPHTAKAYRHEPTTDKLRRLLIDRDDLDQLADSFTKERRLSAARRNTAPAPSPAILRPVRSTAGRQSPETSRRSKTASPQTVAAWITARTPSGS